MLIKKDVMMKRINDKLTKIANDRLKDRELGKRCLLETAKWTQEHYLPALQEAAKNGLTYEEWRDVYRLLPKEPSLGYGYPTYRDDYHEKKLRQNLAILEAIEGDTIEVDKFKTSRNFGFDSLFMED